MAPDATDGEIDALREAVARLEGENARLRMTVENMTDAFWAVDREWHLIYVNSAAERVWGRTREELLGRNIWEEFPVVVGTKNYRAIVRAMEQRTTEDFEDYSPALGLWVSGRAHPTDYGLAVHFQDITRQLAEERARRVSEERYRAVLESIDEGFCVIEMLFDEEGTPIDYRFLETNPAFALHTGLQDATGRTARELVPDLGAQWFEIYGQVALTGEPVRFVDQALAMAGRWFDVYAFRLGGEGSRTVALLFTNITERKHLEQVQQDFVAMASHDLTGPVTVLRARAQLMQRRQAYDEASVEAIIEQTQRMDRLITDLRELVQLETGRLELRREEVDLVELTRAAVERALIQSPQHAIRLEHPDGPVSGRWDSDRLGQVLDNLLGNAQKYSPEGSEIVLRVSAPPLVARVSVSDQGEGVPPEARPHLFERFYRGAQRDSAGGLGLGLYITRMLVEAHGGRVWLETEPRQGSTFTFAIPREFTVQ